MQIFSPQCGEQGLQGTRGRHPRMLGPLSLQVEEISGTVEILSPLLVFKNLCGILVMGSG
jgi:hypothetical protein